MSESLFRMKVDSRNFINDMDSLQSKQIPFALAKTLTELAKSGQRVAKQRTRRVFKLHTDFIPNKIKMVGADKSDYKSGKMASAVYTDASGKNNGIAFMSTHEEGTDKKPRGKALSVPSAKSQSQLGSLKTSTGAIRSKFKAKNLLKDWEDKQAGRLKKSKSDLSGYVVRGIVFARMRNKHFTGNKYNSVPIYHFQPKARIKRQWQFAFTIIVNSQKLYPSYFEKNLIQAISTMRRR
jgi:hypothetical protein